MKFIRIYWLAVIVIISLLAGAQTSRHTSAGSAATQNAITSDINHPPTATASQSSQPPESPEGSLQPPSLHKATLPLPANGELPSAAGELPLLSIVGFGVLLGGTISAMRTRK